MSFSFLYHAPAINVADAAMVTSAAPEFREKDGGSCPAIVTMNDSYPPRPPL